MSAEENQDMTVRPVENPLLPVEVKPVEEKKQEFVLEVVPCLQLALVTRAWAKVKVYVEELAARSKNDFQANEVYQQIWTGGAFLHMGHIVDDVVGWRAGKEVNSKFVGFVISKFSRNGLHLWMSHIEPEYRATNVFELGFKTIKEYTKSISGREITAGVDDNMFGEALSRLGFKKTFTDWKLEL